MDGWSVGIGKTFFLTVDADVEVNTIRAPLAVTVRVNVLDGEVTFACMNCTRVLVRPSTSTCSGLLSLHHRS